jgi:hypothetical protein
MRDRCLPHGGTRHLTRIALVMDWMARSALLGNGEDRADAIEPSWKAAQVDGKRSHVTVCAIANRRSLVSHLLQVAERGKSIQS